MRRSAVLILASLLVLLGVSDTGKQLTAVVSVSNMTGSSQTAIVAPFPLNTAGLLAANAIGTTGLRMEMQDSALAEVPFSPSPTWTAWEGCRVVNAGTPANETTDCNSAAVNDVALLPATGADLETTDAFYFGAHWPFRIISLDIGTAGAFATSPNITWEYCLSAACATSAALANVSDATEGFTKTGTRSVSWDIPDDWPEVAFDTTTSYWVRARVGTLVTSANYTTQPLGDISTYQMGIGFLFACDTCDPTSASFSAKTLANNASADYELFTGQDTARTNHALFVGDAGIFHTDSTNLGTNDWSVRLVGGFDPFASGGAREIFGERTGVATIAWDSAVDGAIDVLMDHATTTCQLTNASSGISDYGRHTILLEVDVGTSCRLLVDGVEVASDNTVSGVLSLTDGHEAGRQGSAIWLEEVIFSIGSTDPEVSTDYEWELTDLSTFDAVTFTNTHTPGFYDGTLSYPAITEGLTATATGFESATTVTGATAEESVVDIIGQVDAATNFAVVVQPTVTVPGAPAVQELANAAGMPSYMIWVFAGIVAAIAALVLTFRFSQSFLLAIFAAGFVAIAIFSMGIFPLWVIFPIAVLGAAILVLGKGLVVGA